MSTNQLPPTPTPTPATPFKFLGFHDSVMAIYGKTEKKHKFVVEQLGTPRFLSDRHPWNGLVKIEYRRHNSRGQPRLEWFEYIYRDEKGGCWIYNGPSGRGLSKLSALELGRLDSTALDVGDIVEI